jgi:hypothetical protein
MTVKQPTPNTGQLLEQEAILPGSWLNYSPASTAAAAVADAAAPIHRDNEAVPSCNTQTHCHTSADCMLLPLRNMIGSTRISATMSQHLLIFPVAGVQQ